MEAILRFRGGYIVPLPTHVEVDFGCDNCRTNVISGFLLLSNFLQNSSNCSQHCLIFFKVEIFGSLQIKLTVLFIKRKKIASKQIYNLDLDLCVPPLKTEIDCS